MLTQRPGQLLPLMSFEAERLEERGRLGGQVRRRAGRRRAVPMPSCVLTVPRERVWDWRARASKNRMSGLLAQGNSVSRTNTFRVVVVGLEFGFSMIVLLVSFVAR